MAKNKRKFYKSIITLTVLSEKPLDSDYSLENIARDTIDGDLNGHEIRSVFNKVIDSKETARLLQESGSSTDFFRLGQNGEDEEDDD